MIAIIKDGVYLDLGDTNVRWETVNTLFEDNALQGDYSFPSMLPLSDINMKAFGFINEADVPKTSIIFDVILQFGERSLPSKLIINGIKRKGFNINIAGGLFGLSNASLKLAEVLENAEVISIPDLSDLFVFEPNDFENIISFPAHYNPSFYGDNNPDFNGVVNRQNTDDGSYLVNTLLLGNAYALVPFIYMHYLIRYIFASIGIKVKGDYWYNTEQSNLLLYNNYALDKPASTGTNAIAYGDGLQLVTEADAPAFLLLSDAPPGSDDDIRFASNVYTVPTDDTYSFAVNLNIVKIFSGYRANPLFAIYLYKKSGAVETQIGRAYERYGLKISVSSNCLTGDEIYYKVVLSTSFLGKASFRITYAKATYQLTSFATYNGMDSDVVLKNHVPNITVLELLKYIKNRAQVDFKLDWEAKEVSIDFAENIINSPPEIDLTDLADPYPEQIFEPKKGFTLSYDFGTTDELLTGNFAAFDASKIIGYFPFHLDFPSPGKVEDLAVDLGSCKLWEVQLIGSVLTWVIYSDYYYPIVVGKGEVPRKIELAPMFMTSEATNEGLVTYALMPTIKEPGNSIMFDQGTDNEPSLRVVYTRGIFNNSQYLGIHKYTFASSTNYDLLSQERGETTMKLDGFDGWYARYMEKIMVAIDNGELFEYKIMLPLSHLVYRGKIQIKNVNYLVKNISTIIGKVVKQSVVKLLKLP